MVLGFKIKRFFLSVNLSVGRVARLADLALRAIALTIISSGAVYRFYRLDWAGIFLSLFLTLASFIILHKLELKFKPVEAEIDGLPADQAYSDDGRWLVGAYLGLFVLTLATLFKSGTERSIVSPWQVLPAYFFAIYALATAVLVGAQFRRGRPVFWLLACHAFLSFSAIAIVYRLGYGFDFFIHSATLKLIAAQGQVEPKPFYYLGQYGLLILFHKLAFLPLDWLARWLVPVLASLFLPLALFFRRGRAATTLELIPAAALAFALPFAFLTFSTPQNFAFLLLLLAVVKSTGVRTKFELMDIFILAAAALLVHPLAGLPALALALVLALKVILASERARHLSYAVVFVLLSIILPLSFYLFERNAIGSIGSLDLGKLLDFGGPVMPGSENFILNFVYLIGSNRAYFFGALAVAGLALVLIGREMKKYLPYVACASALFIAFVLSKALPFDFLIDYERSDYANRLLTAAAIMSFPLAFYAIQKISISLSLAKPFIRSAWLAFFIVLATVSLYLNYPRYDRYFNSKGYSVSASDIRAVRWIGENARSEYIVLANQQVSAAALSQYGFLKYYKDDLFYYPIPTASPLYKYYLKMVYEKPARGTMTEAMRLAGVGESYFVLNKYWWAFPKVLDEAKLVADSWVEIDQGQAYVFKFVKK